MSIHWGSIFETVSKEEGASTALIETFQRTALKPLTANEIADVNGSQRNPFPISDPMHNHFRSFDAATWMMPAYEFPESYLSFLRWSNGGTFTNHGREFDFFPAMDSRHGVRAMMLAYHVPQYMPLAVPIAFDGGGTFYLLDMRVSPIEGEFPVVMSHAGSLGWSPDDHELVANNFLAAIQGKPNA